MSIHIKPSRVAIVCVASVLLTSASVFATEKDRSHKASRSSVSSKDSSREMPFMRPNLPVPFEVLGGGELVLSERSGELFSYPVETCLHLFLVTPQIRQEITRLEQLKGQVRISTSNEALSFVRLKTSPATWYLWEGMGAMEVVSVDQINPSFCFGDENECNSLRDGRYPGMYGVVKSRSDLVALKIKPTEVKVTKNGFEIHRTLITQVKRWGDSYLQEVTESVGYDGSYSIHRGKLRKAPDTDSIKWFFPTIY